MTSNFNTRGLPRRQVLKAAASAGLVGAAPWALAQSAWKPGGTVKIVVPWPPGGASDIIARYFAPLLAERLGQPVIIENKAGATGSIGSQAVYDAPADGLTYLVGILDAQSIYPHLGQPRYDALKFVPVAPIGSAPYLVLARPDIPANNIQEFIALAKSKTLTYGSAGVGGSPHLMMSAFMNAAKIDSMTHVPYQGMAPALQALMGSQIDALIVVAGGSSQLRGKLKMFGVTSSERVQIVSDIPTLTELGVPLVGAAWIGLLAPPGTPANISSAMARTFADVAATPGYKAKLVELGMVAMAQNQADFGKFYQDEFRRWGEIIKVNNVKLQ